MYVGGLPLSQGIVRDSCSQQTAKPLYNSALVDVQLEFSREIALHKLTYLLDYGLLLSYYTDMVSLQVLIFFKRIIKKTTGI